MPRIQYLIPLLRPLAAPRVIASRQRLRFSTASTWRAEQPPPNAKPITNPTRPPNASSQHPSTPQQAQRAADLAAAESLTEGDSAQPPEPKPVLPSKHPRADIKPKDAATAPSLQKPKSPKKQKTPLVQEISIPPPKHHVSRSINKNLPIYTDYKRGGNLHLTTIRKITGDLSALRDELRVFLNKKNEDVKINSLTSHVIVKGHHTSQIAEFLQARGF